MKEAHRAAESTGRRQVEGKIPTFYYDMLLRCPSDVVLEDWAIQT